MNSPTKRTIALFSLVLLVTLMTGSALDKHAPAIARIIRLAGYITSAGITILALGPLLSDPRKSIRSFFHTYRFTLIPALVLYFLGLVIGSLRGPDPAYALQQTLSDAVVFAFALAVFGWLAGDLNDRVRQLLQITALLTLILMINSFIVWRGNLQGWWSINIYNHPVGNGEHRTLMNGPFNHSNHLAYVLMMGSLAAGSLAAISKRSFDWTWWAIAGVLAVGVAITYGRGAMLGTAAGVIAIMFTRHRKIAWPLLITAAVLTVILTLGTMDVIDLFTFLPKLTAGRSVMWRLAFENLREYGPLGAGSGQAESYAYRTVHNFVLEQYGEGGVLTLLGVILWLALPIVRIRTSRLEPRLAWCIVGMMLGLMVHGIFWGQFLNGLRILTLIYVALWTALGTQRVDEAKTPLPANSPAS